MVEVQSHPKEVRIFVDGVLIAAYPLLEGRNRRRIDPAHRKAPPAPPPEPRAPDIRRPLSFYDAVGTAARGGGRGAMTEILDRIRPAS